MKKHIFYTPYLYLGLFGIVLIFLAKGYKETQKQNEKKMCDVFEKTIRMDKDKRDIFPSFSFRNDTRENEGNDSIMDIQTEEGIQYVKKSRSFLEKNRSEKEYIIDQCFLAETNPICPQSLDSLYHSLLQEEDIPAQTAVSYKYKGQIYYSSSDSGFYKSAQVLEPVFIGVNKDYGLTLQAYIKLPTWYITKQYFQKYGHMIGINSLILFVLFYLMYAFYKKENRILPFPPTSSDLKQLIEGLLFDEMHGILIYEEKKITLTNYKLKLFDLLLQHKGFYLTSDFIRQTLWPEGTSSKEALTQTVKRLRAELEPIPVISIQSARNKGYCLTLIPLSQEEKAGQVLS